MAGGFVGGELGRRAELYEGRITGYFILACVVGSLGGSLFGYDLGVSGKSSLPPPPSSRFLVFSRVHCLLEKWFHLMCHRSEMKSFGSLMVPRSNLRVFSEDSWRWWVFRVSRLLSPWKLCGIELFLSGDRRDESILIGYSWKGLKTAPPRIGNSDGHTF